MLKPLPATAGAFLCQSMALTVARVRGWSLRATIDVAPKEAPNSVGDHGLSPQPLRKARRVGQQLRSCS